VLERTDHQLCMPELMAAKLAATAPNGGSWESTTRSSPYLETPAGSARAGWLVTGSRWRLAEGKHGGDQLVQRPGQVVSGD
jgi:hypothetical protein